MNVVELKRLANFLRNEVSDTEFNLDSWVRNKAPAEHARRSCGTIGCAIGLGLLHIQEWKDKGFKMGGGDGYWSYPMYKDRIGFFAVAEFLDISVVEAEHLFSMFQYPARDGTTRHQVADRIFNFIAPAKEEAVQ